MLWEKDVCRAPVSVLAIAWLLWGGPPSACALDTMVKRVARLDKVELETGQELALDGVSVPSAFEVGVPRAKVKALLAEGKAYLENRVLGKKVEVKTTSRYRKTSRKLRGTLTIDGQEVGEDLIGRGYAKAGKAVTRSRSKALAAAEREARAKRTGYWAFLETIANGKKYNDKFHVPSLKRLPYADRTVVRAFVGQTLQSVVEGPVTAELSALVLRGRELSVLTNACPLVGVRSGNVTRRVDLGIDRAALAGGKIVATSAVLSYDGVVVASRVDPGKREAADLIDSAPRDDRTVAISEEDYVITVGGRPRPDTGSGADEVMGAPAPPELRGKFYVGSITFRNLDQRGREQAIVMVQVNQTLRSKLADPVYVAIAALVERRGQKVLYKSTLKLSGMGTTSRHLRGLLDRIKLNGGKVIGVRAKLGYKGYTVGSGVLPRSSKLAREMDDMRPAGRLTSISDTTGHLGRGR